MALHSAFWITAAVMLACACFHVVVYGDAPMLPPTDDAKLVGNSPVVKSAILRRLATPQEYEVVSYAERPLPKVEGTDYYLKVKINSDPVAYMYVRVRRIKDGTIQFGMINHGTDQGETEEAVPV